MLIPMKTTNPISEAIDAAGNASALGRAIGVTPQAIRKYERRWATGRVDAVPPVRAIQIEIAVGIPRHRLRPDLWASTPEAA